MAEVSPEVMDDAAAWAHIALDHVGQHSVGDHPADHSGGQDGWEAPRPDVDDGNGHEGGGAQGAHNVDVAGGEVQDPEPQVETPGEEGALLAEQHLVGALQRHGEITVTAVVVLRIKKVAEME